MSFCFLEDKRKEFLSNNIFRIEIIKISHFHKKQKFICQSPCEDSINVFWQTKSIFLYQNSHLIQSNLPQVFKFCFTSSQWIWSCKSPRNDAFEEEKWTITKWKQFPTAQNWVFAWHGEWHLMPLVLCFMKSSNANCGQASRCWPRPTVLYGRVIQSQLSTCAFNSICLKLQVGGDIL